MLTDSWLKKIHRKQHEKAFERNDRDGMGVRVSINGKITWQLRYRYGGKPKRLSIGTYPATTLKAARDESIRLRGILESGEDPAFIKDKERQEKEFGDSLETLFQYWYQRDCVTRVKSPKEILRSFELHVLPKLGTNNLKSLSIRHWMALLEPLADEKPAIASRILGSAKQMYRWLVRRGLADVNPLAEISPYQDLGIQKKGSYRSLSDNELLLILDAMNKSQMAERSILFMKLCLLYGCRPSELRRADRDHLDFNDGIWTIPPENHKLGKKTNKPLLRPITSGAETLLKEALNHSDHPQFVFTRLTGNVRMGHSNFLKVPLRLSQQIYKQKGALLDHWSFYDFRKTARTNWSTLGEPHVAEIMLGHKLPGDWQIYDQHHYLPEQSSILDGWHSRLLSFGINR